MPRRSVLRRALAASALFNVGGALAFAFPAAVPGALLGLPNDVPLLYRSMVAMFVLLFAGAYAWLARQPEPLRPFVAFGAFGKATFFGLTVVLWLLGEISGRLVLGATGDLVLAAIFAWGLGGDVSAPPKA